MQHHPKSAASTVLRHKRMPLNSAVSMIRGDHAWIADLCNISATGVLVTRPEGWTGEVGQTFVLDMIIGDALTIYLEAQLARMTEHTLGFAFSRIPEEKQGPLWELLGGYADSLEEIRCED